MKNILIFFVLFFAIGAEGTIEKSLHSTGTVKYYKQDSGFGYIIDKETRKELFVYEEGLIDEINNSDKVSFKIRDTRKGLEAYDVRKERK